MQARPISAGTVVRTLTAAGLGPFIGVPCSFLAPLIAWCEQNAPDAYLPANNEGEAVAIAAGAYLAGRRPVVLMQNSGLGNAVNPLSSLCEPMQIPILMLVSWRGRPGQPDEPQHRLMGKTTRTLLDLMEVEHDVLVSDPHGFSEQVGVAVERLRETGHPYALVVPKGSIGPEPDSAPVFASRRPRRNAVIASIMDGLPNDVLVVATTGKTARELEADWDRVGNLYVVGSMGCASSIGLGIALAKPERRVIVLDGDGAALMRLEAMVSIGAQRPENLVHVLLDNAAYESTGSQRTNAESVDFLRIASACGYQAVDETDDAVTAAVKVHRALDEPGPQLIRVAITPGSDPDLGRPANPPSAVAERFRHGLIESVRC